MNHSLMGIFPNHPVMPGVLIIEANGASAAGISWFFKTIG